MTTPSSPPPPPPHSNQANLHLGLARLKSADDSLPPPDYATVTIETERHLAPSNSSMQESTLRMELLKITKVALPWVPKRFYPGNLAQISDLVLNPVEPPFLDLLLPNSRLLGYLEKWSRFLSANVLND